MLASVLGVALYSSIVQNKTGNSVNTEISEITPLEAAERCRENSDTVIIDVRSRVEHEYVGHPPGAVHVPWKEFPAWKENDQFCQQVDEALGGESNRDFNRPLLMLCRSGVRSMAAAKALSAHGYTNVTNIAEGFEGDKDEHQHRGTLNGWRFHGLPWQQS